MKPLVLPVAAIYSAGMLSLSIVNAGANPQLFAAAL